MVEQSTGPHQIVHLRVCLKFSIRTLGSVEAGKYN